MPAHPDTEALAMRLSSIEQRLDDHLKEAIKAFAEVDKSIKCLSVNVARYEPYLKQAVERRRRTDNLQRAVIEKGIVGAVWALIVFVGYACWEYVKNRAHIS